MLQVKNLVKRYKTKGETVGALNGVSVDFPERGMVFLLGKSGSGKSTLLNVAGGLDSPDEGEIIVKGRSSKDFTDGDFDSYRNTYVGFIFQEYNILNEFTVEENVALALELQGKPRDHALIQSLLEQVDLAHLGDRFPNTLSGGQKQRVAIARALVKNPEIIMADEPTGALDSATGKQVFDTLKKLSREKLVVIVSHDREFAEQYADRIIELRDGYIISDVTRGNADAQAEKANLKEISDKKLSIACGAALSEEELSRICTFLKNSKGGFVISGEEEDLSAVERPSEAVFLPTAQEEIPVPEKDEAQFIKSRFPLRHAIKMGFSGLKFKPWRLLITVFLSTVAFIVFGVFSTLVTFDIGKLGANALATSEYSAGVLTKRGVAHVTVNGQTAERTFKTGLEGGFYTQAEIDALNAQYPVMDFIPAFNMNTTGLSFATAQRRTASNPYYKASDYYDSYNMFTAFAEASYVQNDAGFPLVEGTYPAKPGECLVSVKVFESFKQFGYSGTVNGENGNFEIKEYSDLLGKTIPVLINTGKQIYLTVSGILDTGESFSSFDDLKKENLSGNTVERNARKSELKETFAYSMASLCYVSDDFYAEYAHLENPHSTVEASISAYQSRWSTVTTKYTEENATHYQFLFSPLNKATAERSSIIIQRIDDVKNAQTDVVYSAPYSFLSELSNGQALLDKLLAIIGAAAVVLAIFAALLLFNFISASINAKKKDIGILRAVGARAIDIFKIFMVEGLIITVICFALGAVGSIFACTVANGVVAAQNILSFDFFLFDWINALMVFGIAFFTSLIATIIPVSVTVKKKPVEAIRSI